MTGHYFTDDWAAERTGRHRTTVMRWRRSGHWPAALLELARLELDGELGLIDPRWQGFVLCRKTGLLVTPHGFEFTAGELLGVRWRLMQLAALERQLYKSHSKRRDDDAQSVTTDRFDPRELGSHRRQQR